MLYYIYIIFIIMCLDPPFVPITMVFYPTFFFTFTIFWGL